MGTMKDDLYAAMQEGNPAAARLWRERFVQAAAEPSAEEGACPSSSVHAPLPPPGPTFTTGDIWTVYEQTDLLVITTNSTVKANGALVMGRGVAQQARDRMRGLDRYLGRQIAATCGSRGEYNLLTAIWPGVHIAALQVKYHYTHPADPALITRSLAALAAWIATHHPRRVDMVFPGIGNGKLHRADVLPLLQHLPALVHVWETSPAAPVELARAVGANEQPQARPTSHAVAPAPSASAIPLIVDGNVVSYAGDEAEANRWLCRFEAGL
jgi:hypothetical protein